MRRYIDWCSVQHLDILPYLYADLNNSIISDFNLKFRIMWDYMAKWFTYLRVDRTLLSIGDRMFGPWREVVPSQRFSFKFILFNAFRCPLLHYFANYIAHFLIICMKVQMLYIWTQSSWLLANSAYKHLQTPDTSKTQTLNPQTSIFATNCKI